MFLSAAIHNLFSYSFQGLGFIYDATVIGILRISMDLSEMVYTFLFSHYGEFKDKAQDKRSRTTYIRDGYGRRYKKVSPSSMKYDPARYRPYVKRYYK